MRRSWAVGVCLLAGLLTSACSSLPDLGPSATTVMERAGPADYRVIDLDLFSVQHLAKPRRSVLSDLARAAGRAPLLPLGPGDLLEVRVVEAADNGLFANLQSRGSQFLAQLDAEGAISVPHVGRLKAAGRTVEEVRAAIQAALTDRAVLPQVMVAVLGREAGAVTLVGEVGRPGRLPLNPGGTRILDAVAAAGGSRHPVHETTLILTRGGHSRSAPLEDVFSDGRNNVLLLPGDEVLIDHTPRSYTILGAVMSQREVRFETREVTLGEAIGRSGGLDGSTADPAAVFVFRLEASETLARLDPGVSAEAMTPVPVVYRLDLSRPFAYFVGRQMPLGDKDIVYVAQAPSVELAQFLDLVGRGLGTAQTGLGLAGEMRSAVGR